MIFRLPAPLNLSLGIALHAVVIAMLAVAVVHLLATTHYYATSLVLVGFAAMTIASLCMSIARLEAPIVQFMNNALAGAPDIPAWGGRGIETAVISLQEERRHQARQIEYLQALTDSITAALIVVSPDGEMTLANRAARALAGEEAGDLSAIASIGSAAAQELLALNPGMHKIVKLVNGKQILASAAHFALPSSMPYRMIALQSVVGELDAVELKAWQDMARVLAHEMMNSLTPIASLSESLIAHLKNPPGTDGVSGPDVADAIETIGRRSQGLMNFVERYRQFSELPPPRLQPILMTDFVASIDGLMRAVMTERNVTYSSKVEPPDMIVHADIDLLSQAAINLIKNALDAVAAWVNPEIFISCTVKNHQVVIAIADNGCGLSPAQIDNVFVPFFTTKSNGAGIGLSLARQIAMAHGGQIEVSTNTPRGTVFRIVLPLALGCMEDTEK